jgi:hypothetical protein
MTTDYEGLLRRIARVEAEHKISEIDIADLTERIDVLMDSREAPAASPPGRAIPAGMKIVVTGNPIDGMTFLGPFASAEAVQTWAKTHAKDGMEWWTADLENPT